MSNILTFTEKNFKSEVLKSSVPVLVDFWAEWCMPCRMVAPIVEDLSKEYEGKIKVGKLNVDENEKIGKKLSVTSIPVIAVYKDGKEFRKHVGAASRKIMEGFIQEAL